MRITTHACILGAWAPVASSRRILDIGSGTGLLSLMVAQRSGALIDAVEVEPGAALDSRENFTASPWAQRLQLHETPVQLFQRQDDELYDCIISNPPFFSGSMHNHDARKALARHEGGLTHGELVSSIRRWLSNDGRAHILLPSDVCLGFMKQAFAQGLYLQHRLDIRSLPAKAVDRVIMSFRFAPVSTMRVDSLCVYAEYPAYSHDYAVLMRDYYPHL